MPNRISFAFHITVPSCFPSVPFYSLSNPPSPYILPTSVLISSASPSLEPCPSPPSTLPLCTPSPSPSASLPLSTLSPTPLPLSTLSQSPSAPRYCLTIPICPSVPLHHPLLPLCPPLTIPFCPPLTLPFSSFIMCSSCSLSQASTSDTSK